MGKIGWKLFFSVVVHFLTEKKGKVKISNFSDPVEILHTHRVCQLDFRYRVWWKSTSQLNSFNSGDHYWFCVIVLISPTDLKFHRHEIGPKWVPNEKYEENRSKNENILPMATVTDFE